MKNVIILTDNEIKYSKFLINLGMKTPEATLCMYVAPTKLFNFQVFGLLTEDIKLYNYIQTKDGIIILINLEKFDKNQFVCITNIINKFSHVPTLFVVEKNSSNDKDVKLKKLNKLIKNDLTKIFIINYEDKNVNLIISEAKEWFNYIINKKNIIKPIIKLNSQTISAIELAKNFKNGTLDLELWDHYGRLRIVFISLINNGYDETINPNGWLCKNWKKYKTSIGHGHLWHYTLTKFWVNILNDLLKIKKYDNFNDLYKQNPKIQNGKLFQEYYSSEVLFSNEARSNWVKPNLKSFS